MAYTLNGNDAEAFYNGALKAVYLNGTLVFNPVKTKSWKYISNPGYYNGTYSAGINTNSCMTESTVRTRLPSPNSYDVGYVLRVNHQRMIPPNTVTPCDPYYYRVVAE